jgi:hypothetical protein
MKQEPALITDTVLVGFETDGTPVYMTAREAELAAIGNCMLWALDHSHEILRGLGMAAVGGVCGYFMYESFHAERKRKPRRRRLHAGN